MKFGVENSLKWSEIGNLLHGFAEKLWVPKFEKPLFFVLEHCFPIFPKPPVARGQMSFFFFLRPAILTQSITMPQGRRWRWHP